VQGHGNIKFTFRGEHFQMLNVFAIAGPGFLHATDTCCGGHLSRDTATRLTFNFEGGLEAVPNDRLGIRIEATDYFLHTGTHYPNTGHNLDVKLSFMFEL
jgi:hypothetical protein